MKTVLTLLLSLLEEREEDELEEVEKAVLVRPDVVSFPRLEDRRKH